MTNRPEIFLSFLDPLAYYCVMNRFKSLQTVSHGLTSYYITNRFKSLLKVLDLSVTK
jgi:hypothetical protein